MYVVHGTQRFLDHVGTPNSAGEADPVTTRLGSWYATLARWRPNVALFVSEATLLPVLVPAAPARSLLVRFPAALAEVLAVHGVPVAWINEELAHMEDLVIAKTASRSLVGVLNEFIFLAEDHRADEPELDLQSLSVDLARTPMSPLYKRHISPDRELAALAGLPSPRTASPQQSGT
ncbi:MAG: DUF6933 domain-containing protein [Actinomycetes bacterium]